LWFSLLAPAAAFGIEGAFGWWIGARICTSMPIDVGRAAVGAVTLVALAIAGAGLIAAIHSVREANANGVASDRVEFMALGGVFVSTSFLVGVLWFGLNAAFITQCGGVR
jgi:hypothetical protein